MKLPSLKIAVFESPAELAQGAAEEWVEHLRRTPRDRVIVALPGGRIYRLFFEALARLTAGHTGVLDRVDFFWGDERCVPPDNPESNFKLAQELLFQPLAIARSRVHRIRGEDVPASAASAAEDELRSVAEMTPEGLPRIDYVFLGMGEDGHVASLFPGEPGDVVNSAKVYRAVTSPKPPLHRITLGYPAIAAASNVWVLVSGPGKEGALRESISARGATPLGRVLVGRRDSLVLTDLKL